MKKVILVVALALCSISINAMEDSAEVKINDSKLELVTDCEDYATRASGREVNPITDALSGHILGSVSYGYWLGVCESHDPADGELLDPVFL